MNRLKSRRGLLVGVLVVLGVALFVLRIGATATVPEHEWVDVVNIHPVWSVNRQLESGDICSINTGGTLRVLMNTGSKLVTRYTAPKPAGGALCPSGVWIVVERDDFETMTERYDAIQSHIAAEKALVVGLLAQKYYGAVEDVGEWRWINAVNPDSVADGRQRSPVYGDVCGAGPAYHFDDDLAHSGTIRSRGTAPDGRVLYEYTALGSTSGTPCPSGVLFFG